MPTGAEHEGGQLKWQAYSVILEIGGRCSVLCISVGSQGIEIASASKLL